MTARSFRFRLDDLIFHASRPADIPNLCVNVCAGYIPFTAESREARREIHKFLSATDGTRPGTLTLGRNNHELVLSGSAPVERDAAEIRVVTLALEVAFRQLAYLSRLRPFLAKSPHPSSFLSNSA